MIRFLKHFFKCYFFKCHFFKCSCNEEKCCKEQQNNVSASKMLNIWNPYKVSNLDELKEAFQRVFISGDGQKVLQHLTNIAFMGKGQVSNDIASMAFSEGKQSVVLTIFDMLKAQQEKTLK